MKSLIKKTPLYVVFLYLRRCYRNLTTHRIDKSLRKTILDRYPAEQKALFHTLETEGILILPEYFKGDTLKRMQAEFQAILETEHAQLKADVSLHQCADGKALDKVPSLASFVKDPLLKDLATYFWGQSLSLLTSAGYRSLPIPEREFSSYQWHHDCVGKQLKLFLLLTDLPEEGQVLQYLPRSHKQLYVFDSYEASRFNASDVTQKGQPVSTVAKAGSVFLFDTNGLHKGLRNLSGNRDVWMNLPVPITFPQALKDHLSLYEQNPIELDL